MRKAIRGFMTDRIASLLCGNCNFIRFLTISLIVERMIRKSNDFAIEKAFRVKFIKNEREEKVR